MGRQLPWAAAAAVAVAAARRDLCHFPRLSADGLGKSSLSQAVPMSTGTMSSSPTPAPWGGADPSTTGRVATEGTAERRGERLPLSGVVAECVKRWFQDTLKEARAGDVAMQVLVGQMYYSGYGVTRNVQKVRDFVAALPPSVL